MIDSIVFRVHDLGKNKRIVELLNAHANNEQRTKYFDDTENNARDFLGMIDRVHFWKDRVTGKETIQKLRGHVKIPSSTYDMVFSIDTYRDFVEFNFSVPKYLFGQNVFQFVPHIFDRYYNNFVRSNSYLENSGLAYDHLIAFMRHWVRSNFTEVEISFNDIELVSLHCTYNKVFPCKEDALIYLNQLKLHKPKNLKLASQGQTNFIGGLNRFVKSKYLFKIYHKGTEFAMKQASTMRKKGFSNQQVAFLQRVADCIVRYEVEIYEGQMSDIFKDKLFRIKDKVYRKHRNILNRVRSGGEVLINGMRYKAHNLPQGIKYYLKYVREIEDKTFNFFFHSSSNFKESKEPWSNHHRNQTFSRDMFVECQRFFKKLCDEYKVSYINEALKFFNEVKNFQTIKERNEALKKLALSSGMSRVEAQKISYHKCISILEMLRNRTWKDIKELLITSSVYYRYKKFFSSLGMDSDVVVDKLVVDHESVWFEYYKLIEYNSGCFSSRYFRFPFTVN